MEKKRSLFFDTSVIYFIVIAGFISIRILSNLIDFPPLVGVLFNVLIQIIMIAVPFFMYKFLRKKTAVQVIKEFNVKKISGKAILISVLIGFIIYFLNLAVAMFFSSILHITGFDPSFGMATGTAENYTVIMFLGDIIISAILPGICEEFCHRGLLVNGYKQLDVKKTIILVGFLFGLMHLNIEQFFYASIIGMFLTLLVYLTGSIVPSMIIHFLNNAIGIYFSFASANNLPLGNFSELLTKMIQNDNFIIGFGSILMMLFVLVFLLIALTKLLFKFTRVKQFENLAQKAINKKQREKILESFNLDANEIDRENGVEVDDNIPEVIFADDIIPNARKNIIVNIDFKNSHILEGDYIIQKPSLKDKAFLIGTIVLGAVITFFTLIWGIL